LISIKVGSERERYAGRGLAGEARRGNKLMKAFLVCFGVTMALLAVSEARAQMTVDVAKITCRSICSTEISVRARR